MRFCDSTINLLKSRSKCFSYRKFC